MCWALRASCKTSQTTKPCKLQSILSLNNPSFIQRDFQNDLSFHLSQYGMVSEERSFGLSSRLGFIMRSTFRALRHKKFSSLLFGQTLSRIGDFLFQIAMAWWVLEKTGSAIICFAINSYDCGTIKFPFWIFSRCKNLLISSCSTIRYDVSHGR